MHLLQELWDRLRDPTLGGLWIGLVLFSFGLWLMLPFETFSGSSSYEVMEALASELAWGVVMISGSVFLISGSLRDDPEWSSIGGLIAAFCYFFIWSSVTSANWRSTGSPVYFVLMVRSFMLWRAWHEQAVAHRRQYREWLKTRGTRGTP